ncbi:hypothetical protein CRG98_036966 [Punica granatum]|nr:hypothetical protein CRG98_036966 [Punica granatum]
MVPEAELAFEVNSVAADSQLKPLYYYSECLVLVQLLQAKSSPVGAEPIAFEGNLPRGFVGGPDTKLLKVLCNDQKDENDDRAISIVNSSLIDNTPFNGYNYYISFSSNLDFIYGYAACNGKLD